MSSTPDCVLCGSCLVDLPCLSVDLETAIGKDRTIAIAPIVPMCGGITCNVGITLQRLGLSTAVVSYVGNDHWAGIIRSTLAEEGVDTTYLHEHPSDPTTSVAVLVDEEGQRSFLAPTVRTATKSIDAAFVERHLSFIQQAAFFVFGYFGRMPKLEPGLRDLLPKIRALGCRTVTDTGGNGGDWHRLKEILPFLDVFVPSRTEAENLTGQADPQDMLAVFRDAGAAGILGVKLGSAGVVLENPQSRFLSLPAVTPPSPVIDSTGAGDCFMAGLLAGLHRGLDLEQAGRMGTAAGALAVTARGGHTGVRGWDDLAALF